MIHWIHIPLEKIEREDRLHYHNGIRKTCLKQLRQQLEHNEPPLASNNEFQKLVSYNNICTQIIPSFSSKDCAKAVTEINRSNSKSKHCEEQQKHSTNLKCEFRDHNPHNNWQVFVAENLQNIPVQMAFHCFIHHRKSLYLNKLLLDQTSYGMHSVSTTDINE